MRRVLPFAAFAAGILALLLLIPRYDDAQPADVRITRGEAQRIADAEARKLGIPVDGAWSNMTWVGSPLIDKELENDTARRRAAASDPVIGPRLGGYRSTYYRRGLEKFVPYGYIYVSGSGDILAARLRSRPETPGTNASEATLRPLSDAFVRSHAFPGAPSPQFESARPTVLRGRTDWIFRYRVPLRFPMGKVVPYLWVCYNGGKFAGWDLIEEYSDGSQYRGDSGGDIGGSLFRMVALYLGLAILLVVFLKKYHAGEVGVRAGTFLFATTLAMLVVMHVLVAPAMSEGTGLGGLDAQQTSWALAGFQLLIVDIPLALLVFLGWAVGESYARERWGERLASFDAIVRRRPINATTGRSLLDGLLFAPALAAVGFGVGWIAIATGVGHASLGGGSQQVLYLGGPFISILSAGIESIFFPIVAILLILAYSNRRHLLPAGVLIAAALGSVAGLTELPLEPFTSRLAFGWGTALAAVIVFLMRDLLATAVSLFFGSLLVSLIPLATVARGPLEEQLIFAIAVPFVVAAGFAIAGLMTGREIEYSYEDLAPHVKRIVERERVKAEIDAANRIQAALLPLDPPCFEGATVASHYRAATEIGGDYFDFLPQANGEIGIAFGDVSGHGLTSGIVMAMAKAALLVQVEYDSSPRAVMTVLNEIVRKTSPRRTLMTFFFGLLDPRTQSLRFSSAGHLDPYVYRGATGNLEPLSSWGFPLGVKRREAFAEHSVEFDAGDRLVLYSDGLIEAVDDDGEPFGFERFERVIAESGHLTAEEIKKSILASVRKFTRNRPPEDDQTLVVVSFEEIQAGVLLPLAAIEVASESVN